MLFFFSLDALQRLCHVDVSYYVSVLAFKQQKPGLTYGTFVHCASIRGKPTRSGPLWDVSLSVSQTQTVYNGVFLLEGPPDTGDFISSVSDDISRKQE